MEEPTPRYRRGPAEPGQIAKGGAGELNQQADQSFGSAPSINQMMQGAPPGGEQTPGGGQAPAQEPQNPNAPVPGVSYGPPEGGQQGGLSGEDAMLFGPTDRPGEPITAGSSGAQHIVPDYVRNVIPDLRQAAASPDASPQLRQMLKLLMYHIGSNG